jgi:enoyl-CoA hydratase/carnithine racemase
VEIRRPPNNYFDVELIRDLADAFEHLANETPCRVIVLCSEGKHFCAGANFGSSESGAGDTQDVIERGPQLLYDEAARMMSAPLPVVAAVQGAAIGGGLGLACAADFRVACPEARLSANFARLGFHQGFGLSVTLPAIIGQQAALDLLYTGRRVGGEVAFKLGLVDELVALDEVRAAAHAKAAEIAESAPLAIRSVRATMRANLMQDFQDVVRREAAEQIKLRTTEDFIEGVRATAERRPPNFQGK